jgi:hypothetical protein
MKKKLTSEHQTFIVQSLACFMTPTEVVEMLQANFGVKVTRAAISHYNPTLKQSRGTLKPQWIELFEQTRAHYLEALGQTGIPQLISRLQELHGLYAQAKKAKNEELARQVLEQVTQEWSGFYKGAKPVGTNGVAVPDVFTLEDWKYRRGCVTKPN